MSSLQLCIVQMSFFMEEKCRKSNLTATAWLPGQGAAGLAVRLYVMRVNGDKKQVLFIITY